MICQHCNIGKVNRPFGLCWRCYCRGGVRELYGAPMQSSDFNGSASPSEPTDAMPGSEAKVAVLIERARCRQQLFHPADLTFASE